MAAQQLYYERINLNNEFPVRIFTVGINNFKYHWHDEIEIVFVLNGSIDIEIEKKLYKLKTGDIIIINSKEVHSFSPKLPTMYNMLLILQIDGKYFNLYSPFFSNTIFDRDNFLIQENQMTHKNLFKSYLANIMIEEINKREGYELNILGYTNLICGSLLKNYSLDVNTAVQMELKNKDLSRLKNILHFINENYMNQITLKELAKSEYISETYFSHFFKDKIGMSFKEYLNEFRLMKAEELVKNTDENISTIALNCGFPDLKSLTGSFKKKYGITPLQFRIKKLNQNTEKKKEIAPDISNSLKNGSYCMVQSNDLMRVLLVYSPKE